MKARQMPLAFAPYRKRFKPRVKGGRTEITRYKSKRKTKRELVKGTLTIGGGIYEVVEAVPTVSIVQLPRLKKMP